MKNKILKTMFPTIIFIIAAMSTAGAVMTYDPVVNYNKYVKYDRYLDVEIWVDDDAFYEGDEISISFRANKDCYVAIYNIDTKGRVNLVFPNSPHDNNYIESNSIYQIPNRYDSYDLTVQGPEGVEFLQIVASSRPFVIPEWFGGSGIVCDYDPYDFMDFINANYFGGEDGQPRAFDLTSFVVKEWERYYFRPHYYHYYDPWDWGYCGSVYIDYPFGATIYIDGVYWGIAPLFIPRVYFGWHYVTVYDHYGYCWEDRINIVRHRSIVLDNTVIRTKANVRSRFKEVTSKGYLNPVTNGYPDYETQVRTKKIYKPVSTIVGEGRVKYAVDKDVRTIRENSYKKRTETVTTNRTTYKNSNRSYEGTSTREKSTRVDNQRTTAKTRDNSSDDRSYRKSKSNRSSESTESRTYRKSRDNSNSNDTRTYRKSSSDNSSNETRTYRKSNSNSGSSSPSVGRSKSSSSSSSRGTSNSSSSSSSGKSSTTKSRSGGSSSGMERRGK